MAEATALEEAQALQAAAAKRELEQAATEIEGLVEAETSTAERLCEIQSEKAMALSRLEERKKELLEASVESHLATVSLSYCASI